MGRLDHGISPALLALFSSRCPLEESAENERLAKNLVDTRFEKAQVTISKKSKPTR
jgi:hypothetical protein